MAGEIIPGDPEPLSQRSDKGFEEARGATQAVDQDNIIAGAGGFDEEVFRSDGCQSCRDGRGAHRPSPIRFDRVPSLLMLISTTSPLVRYRGGVKPMPTPTGVPVAMMSPGWRVMPALMVSIIVGMSKIRSAVVAFCRVSPLTCAVQIQGAVADSSA